ncbi:MAG TPA: circularly permuted type 2 ATP-grasp protein [Phototrophicaceae bacterium]|nr:circularly permuted type 2 ATP-grasp protein [Phototrophicaceae bacterium]
MIQLGDAISIYHDGLDPQSAVEADGFMREALWKRGLYFGDRPICTVLRPHFYFTLQWAYLQQETEILLSAFAAAHDACMRDAKFRAQLSLEAYEEQLFSLDIGGVIPWTSSRLDSFFRVDENKLQFVEYNAETPAGMGYGDVLGDLFAQVEPMRRFREHYQVYAMPTLGTLLSSLMRAYSEWGGKEMPQIAIADWQDVPTHNEHEICKAFFGQSGVQAVLVDPRALEYRDGHLWAGDFRVDIIYKRVLISEMIQRMGVDNPLVQAVRDRAVMMTNSFSAKLMAKKASFAFLSDERNARLFTPEQLRVIREHIPWTRVVSDRKTVYNNREIDLLEFITDNRDRFVLKPNDEYGGKGVTLGWEATSEQWSETLQQALNSPFVVQERVSSITRDFPSVIDGQLDISPRYVDADPYIFYGRTVYGCLTRLSSVSLLNVTAGGGSVVPTFLLDRK